MLPWIHQIAAQFATALLLTGGLFDLLGVFRKTERFLFVSFWNLLLGTMAAVAAVATGLASQYLLGPHDKMGDALLALHRFGGYVVVFCSVALVSARLAMRGGITRAHFLYLAVGMFSGVLVFATGMLGTTLVLRFGLGIDHATAQRVISTGAETTPQTRPGK